MSEPQVRFLTALQFMSIPATEAGPPSPLRSWIAEGPNEPVTAEQVTVLVGKDNTTDVAAELAITLPHLVDAASPEGELPPGSVRVRVADDGECTLYYEQPGIAAIAPTAAPDQYWSLGSSLPFPSR